MNERQNRVGRNIHMMGNRLYKPLTATPFQQNETYIEFSVRCSELAKYIRCFWGSSDPYLKKEKHSGMRLVIPDTCVDIIYRIDHTENVIESGFCGINDEVFWNSDGRKCGHVVSTFAIRFYAWGAYVFAEDSLKDTVNGFYDVQSRFRWLDRILRQQLLEKVSMEERVRVVEEIFLKRLSQTGAVFSCAGGRWISDRVRHNSVIDQAVSMILLHKGAVSASRLAEACFISSRQLERLFHEYIGITPKKLCNLVRYQCLWSDILYDPGFQTADAVYRYGYTDQSHLLREFKRYHTMDIRQARAHAFDDVGNIQYIYGSRQYNL